MESEKNPILQFLIRLSIALLIFGVIIFFAYRSCTKGYDQYVIYIQVNDESIFLKPIVPSDSRIIDQGRKAGNEITATDQDVDQGDGPKSGKLRWYICGGIDCDEGWETAFLPEK